METVYKINLRFSLPTQALSMFHAVQGDSGTRIIEATILDDNGQPYDIASGITAKFVCKKSDGTGTEHSTGVSISGSVVTVELSEQDLACPGRVYAAIVLMQGDDELTTFPFWYQVEPRPMGNNIESDNDYQTLKDIIEDAEGIGINAVKWVEQDLTDAQQAQARTNIDAASETDVSDLKDDLSEISESFENANYFDRANAELANLMSTPVLVSPKIAVNAGDTFYLSYHSLSPTNLVATPFFTIQYYDVNGTLTGNAGFWVQGVTIPSGTVEIQFIVAQTTAQYIMVAKDAVATTFEEYFEPYTTAYDKIAREDIAELQDVTVKVDEELVFPENFFGVVGKEINVYYENGIQYGDVNTFAKCDISGTLGGTERFCDRLIWTPNASGITEETISFYKGNTKTASLTHEMNFVAAPADTGSGTIKVLVIGDSKVAFGQPTGYMQDIFNDDSMTLELLGTRWGNNSRDSDTTNRHEGRSSWGAYHYCIAQTHGGLTNPFYNTSEVDTVYHTHFDFSKYMTDQGYSGVDYVIINLGTNDFGNSTYIYRSDISAMIKSIHNYDSNIKVIVGLFEGVYIPKLEWATRNASFMEFRKAVMSDHSNEANVYLNPMYLSMSLYDDYAYTTEPLSQADEVVGNGKTRHYVADGIHQNPAGFYKNAMSMYAIIKCIEAGLV